MGLLEKFGLRSKPRTIIVQERRKRPSRAEQRARAAAKRRAQVAELELEIELTRKRRELEKLKSGEDDEPKSRAHGPMRQMREMVETFQLMDEFRNGKGDDNANLSAFERVAKAFGAGLGNVALAYVKAQQGAPEPAPTPTPQLPAGQPLPPATATPDDPWSAILADLVRRSPSEAAAWLLQQQEPGYQQVADALAQASPAQLPALVEQLGAMSPGGAAILRARMDWLAQVGAELRRAAKWTATHSDSPL